MNRLYYGNGTCEIDGSNIRGIQIKYRGNIEITDKTSTSFTIASKNNTILIFPIGEGFLKELFTYRGDMKILSILASDEHGQRVSIAIKKVMDYAELLGTSESITTKSEDLNSKYTSKFIIQKTTLKQEIIPNLHTSNWKVKLYDKEGSSYEGYFHIHINNGTAMTEKTHRDTSKILYYIKNDKLTTTKIRTNKVGKGDY